MCHLDSLNETYKDRICYYRRSQGARCGGDALLGVVSQGWKYEKINAVMVLCLTSPPPLLPNILMTFLP